jgi:hypothetical protein
MPNNRDNISNDRTTFHFLYIDSSESNWNKVAVDINPPEIVYRQTLIEGWREKTIHPFYDVMLTRVDNYEGALRTLIYHNVDPVFIQMYGNFPYNRPFDGILMEVKVGGKLGKPRGYDWEDFLDDISGIGTQTLGVERSILAYGRRGGERIKDTLLRGGFRGYLHYDKFSAGWLKERLREHLDLILEPKSTSIEREDILDEEGNLKRVIRKFKFDNPRRGPRSISLHTIEVVTDSDSGERSSRLIPEYEQEDFSDFFKT